MHTLIPLGTTVGKSASSRTIIADLPPSCSSVRFIVAGGDSAFVTSIEGAEDDTDDAVHQINAACLTPQDVVIAVAASEKKEFKDLTGAQKYLTVAKFMQEAGWFEEEEAASAQKE